MPGPPPRENAVGGPGSSMIDGLVDVALAGREIPDSSKGGSCSDGPIKGDGPDIESPLYLGQKGKRVNPFAVNFVDEGDNRKLSHAGNFKEFECLGFDPLGTIKKHDHRIHGLKGAKGVFAEILVARRIKNIECMVPVVKDQGTACHADPTLSLDFHPVACRVSGGFSGLDGPRQVDGSAIKKKLLRQGCLSSIGMADDGKGSTLGNFGRKL